MHPKKTTLTELIAAYPVLSRCKTIEELMAGLSKEMNMSLAQIVSQLVEEEQEVVLEGTDSDQLVWDWNFWGRPGQIPPTKEEREWSVFAMVAGRGAGKTRSGAEWVHSTALANPGCRIALVARTAADARDVMVNGEALALDTPVPTPTGWTTMGDIKPNDIVISGTGLPTKVLNSFPVLENRECYEVVFSNGDRIVADRDHKWLLSDGKARQAKSRSKKPINVPSVYTTIELLDNLRHNVGTKSECWNYSVETASVDFDCDYGLDLDPYTLGMWLGDGRTRDPSITICNTDIEETLSFIPFESRAQKDYDAGSRDYHFFGLRDVLRSMGLLDNKHIPREYFRASREDRIALVQGLMDSDGSVSGRTSEFSNTNRNLIDGISELLASLGIRHSVSPKRYPNRNVKPAWSVSFVTSQPVFRLSRKLSKLPIETSKTDHIFIKEINAIDSIPVRCIEVEDSSHTFMVGKTFIPTHNSGIMNVGHPDTRPTYLATRRLLKWPNGSIAQTYSSEEPDQLRGPQFHFAWADEAAAWRHSIDDSGLSTWDNLEFATRLPNDNGTPPQKFITTTPKRTKFMFDLIAREKEEQDVVITRGSTMDNSGNLDPKYMERIQALYAGTRLAEQELYGLMLEEIEGALWNDALINNHRIMTPPGGVPPQPPLKVIAVDPSVAENPTDECGIIVAGAGKQRRLTDRHAYIIEDASIMGSPSEWAQRVVDTYNIHKCPVIVETNQGGALARTVIHGIDSTIPIFEVHAHEGKMLRAEPVTLKYDKGRVHHLDYLPELESQMVSWVPGETKKSPDRVDAMVYAITALLIRPPKGMSHGKMRAHSRASRRLPEDRNPKR